MATTPTPVKRQARAYKVFGNAMFEEQESSLSYSPSPGLSVTTQNNVDDSTRSSDPTPLVLFKAKQKSEPNEKDESTFAVEKENVVENKSNQVVSFAPEKKKPSASIRQQEMNRLRAAAVQSPMKRDLVKKTQNAINLASVAINHSMKPSKSALASAAPQKSQRTEHSRKVRFQWKEECAEAKSFNEAAELSRRQFLNLKRDLSSKHFKAKALQDQEERKKKIQQIDEESQFKSEVFRDHQKKLKSERDNNRRRSIEARAKIREDNKKGGERLKMMQIEEEAAIFDARYDSSIAQREAKKQIAAARRRSFAFRGGDARRIRELRATWEASKMDQDHANFELDQQAARDVENYKKQMEKARRESLALRNSTARRVRQEEDEERSNAMVAEHESYELKWAGEKDAEEYRKKMLEERRKSLAGRNKESARHAHVMKEIRSLANEKQTESFVLKWAGENDAKEYLKKMAEERRKSLKFRGEEHKRHMMYDSDLKAKEINEAAVEGALQSECQKDVENYKKDVAEKKRNSLEYRGKEFSLQRMESNSRRQKQVEVEHQNFELETEARFDVEEYIKDCKNRRRLSLAFRAKEKRRHADWKRQEKERKIEESSRDANYRAMDQRYVRLAQQKERARMAVNALRDIGCSIQGNPFADLLGS